MIPVSNSDCAAIVRILRAYGATKAANTDIAGLNSRRRARLLAGVLERKINKAKR